MIVSAPLEAVAHYLSDLANRVEWDGYTTACRALDDGPVRVGSRYRQRRAFGRWAVELDVEVVELVDGSSVAWRSTTRFGRGTERFAFAARDGHTEIEHWVTVELVGPARVGRRLVPGVMARIAEDGTPRLEACLARLG